MVSVGVALNPMHNLTVAVDGRVGIWQELKTLTLMAIDPGSGANFTRSVPLDLHTAWGIHAGIEHVLWHGHLPLRIGGGYETSPVPNHTLSPFLPDADRPFFSLGMGMRMRYVAIDIGYLAKFLLARTASNPDLEARYRTNVQQIAFSMTFQCDHLRPHKKHHY
jgi:long-chain fatty acid transport protein